MTDFMCEPAALNDWIAGTPGSGNPASFDDDTPAVQLASRGDTITAHAGILAAAKAVVNDLQVGGKKLEQASLDGLIDFGVDCWNASSKTTMLQTFEEQSLGKPLTSL